MEKRFDKIELILTHTPARKYTLDDSRHNWFWSFHISLTLEVSIN